MKLHGRITFFGEYLLKDNLSYCLCIKSKLFLSNEQQYKHIEHPTYSHDKDKTIYFLRKHGVTNFADIYGNLPLGYGLSSSTILSLLHLNSQYRKKLIENVDKKMHGFSPSELDYTSITKQENGVYGFGMWQPFKNFKPCYSLLVIPKEEKRNLTEIKKKMNKSKERQIALTNDLFKILASTGNFDFSLLFDYCKLLLSYEVYSEGALDIAANLIAKGISCKCIGGLYDKAILIIHSDDSAKIKCDKYILTHYNFASILE